MLSIQNLGKSFGARTLFEGVDLTLNAGSRYGLVGSNGSGKTTLLKILSGDETASEGTFSLPKGARIGVLRQDRFIAQDTRVIDLAMMGDVEVYEALVALDDAERAGDAARLAELEERIFILDGRTLRARAASVLEGLGIPAAQHEGPLGALSGGFQLRVLLSQVLLSRPDLLLLDEPTNHLDILSIRWLEKFLSAFQGCAVVISHDQRFLDNVITHTLDVDYETVTQYTGNFSRFLVEKAEVRAQKETEIGRAEAEIARKKAFVERFGAKATKAKQAQSRLKQIEKIEVEELKGSSRRAPVLRFVPERPSGRDVLTVKGLSKAYGEKKVLSNVSLTVRRGERVAIIGANGLGKSTLVRALVERLSIDAGKIEWGHEARVGYFPQDHTELLTDHQKSVLNTLWDTVPMEGTSFVRGELGRALFSGSDVEKPVGKLSGGEAARLVFAMISVKKPNVLVFDEPTNHLDLEAIQELARALKTFDGTVLFVSHNRWFVSEIAQRIVDIQRDGVVEFPGSYDDYLARSGDDHLDSDAVAQKAAQQRAAEKAKTRSVPPPANAPAAPQAQQAQAPRKRAEEGPSWEEVKRRRNRLKVAQGRRDTITLAIDALEARLKELEQKGYEDGFYANTPASEIRALEHDLAMTKRDLDARMAEWETLEIEIIELSASLEGKPA